MQFLTQWKFLDLRSLGQLLGSPSLMEDLKQHVASEGFGQMRWYGAQRQTTRHSDGFVELLLMPQPNTGLAARSRPR